MVLCQRLFCIAHKESLKQSEFLIWVCFFLLGVQGGILKLNSYVVISYNIVSAFCT